MNFLFREWGRIRQSALARNASWITAGYVGGLVLQVVYFAMLARLLGAMQYGIFVGAFAFTSLVAQYGGLGTGTVLMRYVAGNRKAFAVYWGNVLLVTLGLGCLFVMVMQFLAPYALNPASAALVLLAGIGNCVCAQLIVGTGQVFQAMEKMGSTVILNLLANLMRTLTAAGMLLALHRATAWQWAVASLIVSATAALVAVTAVTVTFGWPQLSPKLFLNHGMEGLGYSFASSTASVYNDIDKSMLSHYGMNLANGIYSIAYRVIDVAAIPVVAMRDAALPQLFQRGRAGLAPAAELSYRLLKRALPVTGILTVGMFVTAPLIPHLLGNGFAESVTALRWLCLIPVFRSVHQMTGSALTGAGLQGYRTTAQLMAAAFNFGLNLWLIPHYGWRGAAWSSLATDGALGVMSWGILRILIAQSTRQEPCPSP